MGIGNVHIIDPTANPESFRQMMRNSLASNELTVLIARRPCVLAAGKIKQYEKELETGVRSSRLELEARSAESEAGACFAIFLPEAPLLACGFASGADRQETSGSRIRSSERRVPPRF